MYLLIDAFYEIDRKYSIILYSLITILQIKVDVTFNVLRPIVFYVLEFSEICFCLEYF